MLRTLKPYGLTSSEWSILGIAHEESKNGGIRVSDLAIVLDVQTSYVTNMVRRLQHAGYLELRFDEDDGRVRLIEATPKAHLLVIEIERELRKAMRQWLSEVEIHDLMIYVKVLNQIAGLSSDAKSS